MILMSYVYIYNLDRWIDMCYMNKLKYKSPLYTEVIYYYTINHYLKM